MIRIDKPFHLHSQDPQAFNVGKRHGHMWCHLWCDPGEEEQLHRLARQIGMQRAWFQDKPGFPHYDLVPPKAQRAINRGAVLTDLAEWLRQRRAESA